MSDRSTSGPRNPWNNFQQKIARVVKIRDKGYAARLYREYNSREERERDLSPERWYILREARVQLALEKRRLCTITSEVHRVTEGDNQKGTPESVDLQEKMKNLNDKCDKLTNDNVEVMDKVENMEITIVLQQNKIKLIMWMLIANQLMIGILMGVILVDPYNLQVKK